MISEFWIILTFVTPVISYLLSSKIRALITKYSHKGFIYLAALLTSIFLSRFIIFLFFFAFQSKSSMQNIIFLSSFIFWLLASKLISKIYKIDNNDIALLIILNFGEITWLIFVLAVISQFYPLGF